AAPASSSSAAAPPPERAAAVVATAAAPADPRPRPQRGENDHDDEDEEDQEGKREPRSASSGRGLRGVRPSCRLDDPDAGRRGPARVRLLAERREEPLLEDAAGEGVGEPVLEAVPDLDPRLPVGEGDQEENAVVLPLLAETPTLVESVGEVLDRFSVEGREDRDDDLGRALPLVARELGLDRLRAPRIQRARPVV